MRNPEQEIDTSIFDEMSDQDAYEYIKGKYSKELQEEMKVYLDIIINHELPIHREEM